MALSIELNISLSETKVPTFAFGMRPLGPRIFPNILSFGKSSGVVNNISKSVFPFLISNSTSLSIKVSTPAFASYYLCDSSQKTATLVVFPNPAGIKADPLTIWSPFLGLTPSWMQTSTDSVKLVNVCALINLNACHGLYSINLSSAANILGLFFCLSNSLRGMALRSSKENRAVGLSINLMDYINITVNSLKNNTWVRISF